MSLFLLPRHAKQCPTERKVLEGRQLREENGVRMSVCCSWLLQLQSVPHIPKRIFKRRERHGVYTSCSRLVSRLEMLTQ